MTISKHSTKVDSIYLAIFKALSPELGATLAHEVAIMAEKTAKGNLAKLQQIFYAAGASWAPLIFHWRNWLMEKSLHKPVLIMRDAKPLSVLPNSMNWQQAWINRFICGIYDELSEDTGKTQNSLVADYLVQENLNEPFTFVDGGCWGTIVKELHGIGIKFQPLFFYSHNPNIPGFLNELGVPDSIGEILNDSFECAFLNTIERPTQLIQNETRIIQPNLQPIDGIIAEFGMATLHGLGKTAELLATQPLENVHTSVERMIKLSEKAKKENVFTGILHTNSPTWSEGAEFLASWPQHLKWT